MTVRRGHLSSAAQETRADSAAQQSAGEKCGLGAQAGGSARPTAGIPASRGFETEQDLAVYVHIPFCLSRCGYCDFPTFVAGEPERTRYLSALTHEIERRCGSLGGSHRAATVYFGGGTPSLLTADQLEALLRALRAVLPLAADAEVSLEANPGTVSLEGLRAYRSLGVTRLSIGVQSFSDVLLPLLDRDHTAAHAVQAFAWAREAGFQSLSLDLMFGLPGQSREDWRHDLETASSFRPDHLSLYALTLEEGTPFFARHARGQLLLPDDDEQATMYEWAVDRLEAAGYRAYEISNFALPAHECRHNLAYWRYREYLGLGVGACSFMGAVRRWNTRSLRDYLRSVEEGADAVAGEEHLPPHTQMGEYLMMGLRTRAGIDLRSFARRFGLALFETDFAEPLLRAVDDRLLRLEAHQLSLTPRGILLSNQIFCKLF